MIEMVEAFKHIASMILAVTYHKAKSLGYYDVMLFLEKEEREAKCKLPSLTSTSYLGREDLKYAEENIDIFDNITCEQDLLKKIKERFRHTGAPEEFLTC